MRNASPTDRYVALDYRTKSAAARTRTGPRGRSDKSGGNSRQDRQDRQGEKFEFRPLAIFASWREIFLLLLIRSVVRIAAHVLVPVHERAGRAVLPRPDVQCVERRQSEAIRRVEKVEDLTVQLGRLRVRLVPGRSIDDVVGAGELWAPLGRLVQDDFRLIA